MIVKSMKNGRGFLGAWKYCNHDERSAEQKATRANGRSRERVEWTHTENLCGMSAEKDTAAWLMIQTAQQNRRMQKPVSHVVISYPTAERPEKDKMIADAKELLKALKLDAHQSMFFAHADRDHKHLHIITNRVHPQTLKGQSNSFDYAKMQAWALQYERDHGKIYCQQRENRAHERDLNQGKNLQRYADNVILAAWEKSDGGKAFQAALEARGWKLGLGDRKDRFLALSPSGKPLDILREINKTRGKGEALKLADIEKRFADLKRDELKRIADLQKEQEAERDEKKRRELFKQQGEKEASKAFHKAADDERRQIERLHRELTLQHTEQQRIHQEAATRQRQEAQQEIKDTYALPEQAKNLKALQQRQNAKATLWGKLSGIHEREQQAIKEQIKQQRRQIDESQRLAALHEKHIEDLIRIDADDLARKQAIERHKLPPIPPDRSKGKEQEQQRPQFERDNDKGRGLDFDR